MAWVVGDLLEFAWPHRVGDGEEEDCLGDDVGGDHDDDDMWPDGHQLTRNYHTSYPRHQTQDNIILILTIYFRL